MKKFLQNSGAKAWLYLLPAMLFLGIFMVYPLIDVFVYSFEEGYNSASQTYFGVGLYNYSYVGYDARDYEFDVMKWKCEPKPIQLLQTYHIDDLIPWERLASCFDVSRHCLVTTKDGQKVRSFTSWERNTIPAEEKGYYHNADFGWHEVLVPLDEYIKGNAHRRINEDLVNKIDYNYYNKD